MSETNNTKQAAWVALGSMFSFAFGIVSSMILSRYFDKIEYGTYKQVLYIYNSLLAVFTLGLPKAYSYFLPRCPLDEAKSLIKKITNLFFILGAFLSLILYFGAGFMADFLKNPLLKGALQIFSPVPFFMMPTMGIESILAVYRKTKFISLYVFITRLIMLLCVALPVVMFGLVCNDALIGFVIGAFISFLLALYLKYLPVKNEGTSATSYSYKEIFKFTYPLFVASIWGVLINSTDQFFVSRYFGTEEFAVFSNGAMELPFIGMIIGACSTVLTPLFAKNVYEGANFKEKIYPVWNSSLVKSAMLIYPIVIFCFYDSNLIMELMYGSGYSESGNYFRLKLFTYFVKIISFYSVLVALGATKFYEKVFMLSFFVLALGEYISLYVVNSPLVITGVHVVVTISMCVVFLVYIAKRFEVSFCLLFPLRASGKIVISSLLSVVLLFCVKYFYTLPQNNWIIFCFDLFVFGVFYLSMCLIFKINYLSILVPLLKK